MIVEEKDKERIKILIDLRKASKDQTLEMVEYIKKYIDPKCKICPTCPTQVQYVHKKLKTFYNSI